MKGTSLCLVAVLSLCVVGRSSSSSSPEASPLHRAWPKSATPESSAADMEEEFRRLSEEQMQRAFKRHSARAEVAASAMTVFVQTKGTIAQELRLPQYDILANIIGAVLYLSNPTFVVIVPSFVSSFITGQLPTWVQTMANCYIGKNASVVITVNWNNVVPAGTMNYYNLVIYALAVARELATLIVNVNDTLNAMNSSMRAKSIEVVGFDIGAHIAGQFGSIIKGLSRITGLDPAGPYFDDPIRAPSEYLNKESADFVDIIHTNGGSLLSGAVSFFRAVADVDYYVNGGTTQPGCDTSAFFGVSSVINYLLTGGWLQNTCASNRAIEVFTESLKSNVVPSAFTCANYANFANGECLRNTRNGIGRDVSKNSHGKFYFNTLDKRPYLAENLELVVQPVSPVGSNIAIQLSVTGPGGYKFNIPNIVDVADQGQRDIMGLVLAPLGTNITALDFSVQYQKPLFCFWCTSNVEIKQVLVSKTDLPTIQTLFAYFTCGLWLATSFNIILLLTGLSPCTGIIG